MTNSTVDSILTLYANWGSENYDEEVSQLSHALQCAALAAHDQAPDALIAAALLHDIGHLFEIEQHNGPDHRTDRRHEMTGSTFLSTLFPPDVTEPIALHVDAKRHLAATDTDYVAALSEGSKRSLLIQGGPFTEAQSAEFLERPGSADAIRLRRWDDHGKVIGLDVPDLSEWIPLLERLAIS